MNSQRHVIHVGSMQVRPRRRPEAPPERREAGMTLPERLLRDCALCTAAVLAALSFANVGGTAADGVLSRVAAAVQTDYDPEETLGRLQFVQNLMPESVLVFWNAGEAAGPYALPEGDVLHAFSAQEPWVVFSLSGEVRAAAPGEVMSVTQGDDGRYTLRLLHADGSETLYGGLCACSAREGDIVSEGEALGEADGELSFEIRRGGERLNPADVARR